jgi:4-hydroxy-tetrahydrodipicolinate reductase
MSEINTSKKKVALAGVTGWTGKSVAAAILESEDLELVAAVSRKAAGQELSSLELPFAAKLPAGTSSTKKSSVGNTADNGRSAQAESPASLLVSGSVARALEAQPDIFVDYTSALSVRDNVLAALELGVSVVIGSSGLTSEDFEEIERIALQKGVGVIACGNFSITAALAKHFSLLAARYVPQWEIIDYAHASKVDVPSGTVRELAEELSRVKENLLGLPLSAIKGPVEARGAQIAGTPVHSVRLPSYVIAFETIFGLADERLVIKHEAGTSARPYVDGTLLAIRKVSQVKGLIRGLDRLLFD